MMNAHRKNIQDLRNSYQLAALDEADLLPDPFEFFHKWWEEAIQAEIPEPNAMTLATVDSAGKPSARIILLKGASTEGFEFYTNHESRKASDMGRRGFCQTTIWWSSVADSPARQLR